jgi:hypothetical protein
VYPAIALFCCCDSEYEVNVNSGAANGATVVVEAAVVEVVGGRFDTGTGTAVVEAAVVEVVGGRFDTGTGTAVVEAAVVEVVGGRFDTGTGTAVVEAAVEATAEVEVVGADVVGSTKVVVVPIFGF